MPTIKIKTLLLLVCLVSTTSLLAQDKEEKETIGSETVVVVKPYTPSVSDAFKVKAVPVLNDSISLQKKAILYKIFSVPVASTFTPAKGRATRVERAKPIKAYDNYATLGIGNFTSALAEFYTNFEIDRGQNLGFNLKHNSAQGGIDGIDVDDKYYDTSLNLDFSSRDRDLNYNLGFEALHKLYNWYGIPNQDLLTETELNNLEDVNQNYFGAGVTGSFTYDDSVFEKGRAGLSYFGDSYGSTEINAVAKPEFAFDIAGERFSTTATVDYINGSFDQDLSGISDISYSFLNLGISPSILILRDDLELSLGASAFYSLDSENSDSDVFIYPNINASYRVVDEYFIAYAGLNGELQQNTYKGFVEQNPFLSPTQFIAPTDKQYEGSLGVRGKLSEALSYNVKGSYDNSENKPLFLSNPDNTAVITTEDGYNYGNSFGVVYDNISTISFFGELNYDVSKAVRLGVNAEFFSYDTEFEDEAWNLPELKASLLANVKITEKISAGANLFFVGEREALSSITSTTSTSSIPVTLDGYLDANLQLNYNVNQQLSLFVRGNNLLDDNYEKWLNFPVYGIQGMAGATYKFDW